MTTPTARKCSSCNELRNEQTLTKLGDKYLCQICLTHENTKSRATAYRERKQKVKHFTVKCDQCKKTIPTYLEQHFEEKVLCPTCFTLAKRLKEQITEVNLNGGAI